MGDYLFKKDEQPEWRETENWLNEYQLD